MVLFALPFVTRGQWIHAIDDSVSFRYKFSLKRNNELHLKIIKSNKSQDTLITFQLSRFSLERCFLCGGRVVPMANLVNDSVYDVHMLVTRMNNTTSLPKYSVVGPGRSKRVKLIFDMSKTNKIVVNDFLEVIKGYDKDITRSLKVVPFGVETVAPYEPIRMVFEK